MSLEYLADLFESVPIPNQPGGVFSSGGVAPAFRPAAIAALAHQSQGPLVVVAPRQDRATRLVVTLRSILGNSRSILSWDAPDPLPYEQLPYDGDLTQRRVELLHELTGSHPADAPIVVTTVRALMTYIRSPESFQRDIVEIAAGSRVNDRELLTRLIRAGYRYEPVADRPGTLSRRGGIIDVFTPGESRAVRIELFGDEIESVRQYDPATQRTTAHVSSATLIPPLEYDLSPLTEDRAAAQHIELTDLRPEVRDEWSRIVERVSSGEISEAIDLVATQHMVNRSSILAYLPRDSRIITLDPETLDIEGEQIELRAAEVKETLQSAGELPGGLVQPFPSWNDVRSAIHEHPRWHIGLAHEHASELRTREAFVDAPLYAGDIERAMADIARRLRVGWRIIIVTEQSERVSDLLAEHELYPRTVGHSDAAKSGPPLAGTLDLIHLPLDQGFGLKDPPTLVLTDLELFGIRKVLRSPARPRPQRHRTEHAYQPGDYVVHVEHGVGRFSGLVSLATSGIEREYLQVDYAEGDRLYVPVDQSDRLTKYESPVGEPRITKLASAEWSRTKARVRRAVREMAHELIQVYAARELAQGTAYPGDSVWDTELAHSFPYQETADQLRAIDDVKRDLETPIPMDRLVCGDVGYGKTEVALRAAFKVVNAGRQVAVLVPTTVLALQHFETFRERLAAFPVRVEMLSRLRTRDEQRRILESLSEGGVDIVIGTHRLVQKDVRFKDLGLLVVDEEQRFGVRHKEHIRRLRAEIDVLTMTATPIPRTLHMALTGLRDLSLITTPPHERVPIRTFVTQSDDHVVREAILRELQRGGQIYVVHNRVQSIERIRAWLEDLVPEASYVVGHGQMDERDLEEVILSFMRHDFDVLICTTIIESGVDIPNVNTIIIDNAHALGLTQLYQLRGRVGRGSLRAYAYLLYPARTPLSAEARQRLAAIQEATELGAGFQIALRDMEIRGAGNVLGAEQSGHIASVGLDLYTRMLSHAVEELRSGRPIMDVEDVNLDVAIDARIPTDYIDEESLRLSMYQRIASANSPTDLGEVRAELTDRFGDIPGEVEQIFDLVRLRMRARDLGITALVERDGVVYIRPVVGARLDQASLRQELGAGVHVTPNQVRLRLDDISADRMTAIETVLEALEDVKHGMLVG